MDKGCPHGKNVGDDAFGEAEAAAVEEQHDEAVGWLEVGQDGVDFSTGKDDGHVAVAFGANDAVHFPEFPAEDVPEEEEEGIECLVLAGSGDAVLNGKSGEEAADLLGAELAGGPAADEGLEFADPNAVNSQSLA